MCQNVSRVLKTNQFLQFYDQEVQNIMYLLRVLFSFQNFPIGTYKTFFPDY